ncbi:MAG: hypothetical protein Q4G59_00765, partial [Planctomycetia bacterium]|nr:hypothetical protein [Planctomycetia bacterium]
EENSQSWFFSEQGKRTSWFPWKNACAIDMTSDSQEAAGNGFYNTDSEVGFPDSIFLSPFIEFLDE